MNTTLAELRASPIGKESAYWNIGASVKFACDLIGNCETALKRRLDRGECNDLLLDNTVWSRSEVVAVMDSIRGAP